jgi:hypothetical protein
MVITLSQVVKIHIACHILHKMSHKLSPVVGGVYKTSPADGGAVILTFE